jgi:hypothetical protein
MPIPWDATATLLQLAVEPAQPTTLMEAVGEYISFDLPDRMRCQVIADEAIAVPGMVPTIILDHKHLEILANELLRERGGRDQSQMRGRMFG